MDPTGLWVLLGLAWLAALLSSACAFVAASQAARLSRVSSDFADFRLRLTALETSQDKILELQKRLAVRLNLAEGKAKANRRENGSVPDWRDDPEGYRSAMEAELGIARPPLKQP